jgi:hypothetical protein
VPTPDHSPLIADCQAPAATQAAALEHRTPIFIGHAMQKAMLTTTWNSLWLPGSLGHCFLSFCSPSAGGRLVLYFHDNRRAARAGPAESIYDGMGTN